MKYRIRQETHPGEGFIRYYPQFFNEYITKWRPIGGGYKTDFESSVYLIKDHKSKNPEPIVEIIEHYLDTEPNGDTIFKTKEGELTSGNKLSTKDIEHIPTDILVKMIIKGLGMPLPKFDYKINRFVYNVPKNMPAPCGGVTADDTPDECYTFRDACIEIVNWGVEENLFFVNWENTSVAF
jgi:hypothetical protein